MKKTISRSDVVDALSLSELCQFCQADEAWVIELVEHGVLDPQGHTVETWRFVGVGISRAKKARRLNHDLGVNIAGIALVLDLLEERESIMRRLAKHEVM